MFWLLKKIIMKSTTYKVICLDYYGTLVHLDKPFECIRKWILANIDNEQPVYSHMLRRYAQLSSENQFYMRGSERLVKSLDFACKKLQLSVNCDDFFSFLFTLFSSPTPYSDVYETIHQLRKYFYVGIASNADNDIIQSSIKRNAFKTDFVITSEDARAEKPSTEFFSYVKQKVKEPITNIIFIGDSWKDDVWGAGRFGIDSIWLNRENMEPKDSDISPKYIISSLSEILSILGKDNKNKRS